VAGYMKTRCRPTVPRRLLMIVVATAVVLSVSGCGDDDDDDESSDTTTTETVVDTWDAGTTTTTVNPEVEAALAELGERLASNPDQIATDMQLLGLTWVLPQHVDNEARILCDQEFDPTEVTSWLYNLGVQNQAPLTRFLLADPANRLLRYSGERTVCYRSPTPTERATYEAAVVEFLYQDPRTDTPLTVPPGPTELPPGLPEVPRVAANAVCDVLGTPAGSGVAEATLESLVGWISGGRSSAGRGFIPAVVWIAGAACKHLLPNAVDAVYQSVRGQP
jgi:hypothetical protein